jgi:hypothetical protein
MCRCFAALNALFAVLTSIPIDVAEHAQPAGAGPRHRPNRAFTTIQHFSQAGSEMRRVKTS